MFENVCRHFLGDEEAENYGEIVQELISLHSAVVCDMSFETSFSAFSFGFLFPWKLGAVSHEHGETFHQDISQIDKE